MLLRRIRNRLFRKPQPMPAVQRHPVLRFADPAVTRPVNYPKEPHKTVMPLVEHEVPVAPASRQDAPQLEREGFARVTHQSALRDFLQADAIAKTHFGELEDLIRSLTGARAAYALPHPVVRSNAPVVTDLTVEGTAGVIHIDYTARSAQAAARAALAHAGIEQMPTGRMVAYTVWRSITPPPQDHPLALCDLRSLHAADFVTADSHGASGSPDEDAEFSLLRHREGQVWSYFPDLTVDEVVVFKQYDSALDGPSGVPHSAFDNSGAAAGSVPRTSIEVRVFAFG